MSTSKMTGKRGYVHMRNGGEKQSHACDVEDEKQAHACSR